MRKTQCIAVMSLVCLVGIGLSFSTVSAAQTLASRLKGRILLQVQAHGEAWYVAPQTQKRILINSVEQAQKILRLYGTNITNQYLTKIQVADMNLSYGLDRDGDGLGDDVERGFGTDPLKTDTDGDGYPDKEEIVTGHSPLNKDKTSIVDKKFAATQKGRLVIQSESLSEVWYVNPVNNKRYLLSDHGTVRAVIQHLSLGITNKDLAKIPVIE